MKKYLLFLFPIIAILLIGITSCKRSFERDFAGPLICPSDNFAVTTPLTVTAANGGSTANFSSMTESVLVNAQFNESIGWTVKLIGITSGAVKTYTGTSNQIAISWVGQPDNSFFQAESIRVDLILACSEEVLDSEFFNITTPTFLQMPGFMTDFDNAKSTTNNPSINGNAGASASPSLRRVQPSNPSYNNVGPSPQGGSYFNIHSYETNPNDPKWYYGGFEVNPVDGNGDLTPVLNPMPGLNSDPSTVYLNFYANCNGVPNSQIQVAVTEFYKTTGVENVKTRKATVNLNWTGWKMVSIKLSDIGILDPRKISGIQFGLGAYLNKDILAEANMDMVIFTNDGPLLSQ